MALIASRANGGTTLSEIVTLGSVPAPGQSPVGVGFACATRGASSAAPVRHRRGAGLPQSSAKPHRG